MEISQSFSHRRCNAHPHDPRDQSTQSSLATSMACHKLRTSEVGQATLKRTGVLLVSPFPKLPRECMMCSGMFRHAEGVGILVVVKGAME